MGSSDNFDFKDALKIFAQNYLNSYKRQLPAFTDEEILEKLETASGEVYKATLEEAHRRKLL